MNEVKEYISHKLEELIFEIRAMLNEMNGKNDCLLCDLDGIRASFDHIQASASTYYLQSYLGAYTANFSALSKTISALSEKRHGALIVVEREVEVTKYIQNGVILNAELSSPLLESIFYPGNPLHDGAVLIRREVIVSAANILPLTKKEMGERKIGTRHRAALGLSELLDALILVVSEETGKMSFAKDGILYPINRETR